MAGTKAGGLKAALTNKLRHGSDFYARIGEAGGKKGTTGGFAANPQLAREAGRKGGMISRRRKVVAEPVTTEIAMEKPSNTQNAKQNDFDLAA